MDFKKLLRSFLVVLICSLSIQLYFITNGSFENVKYIDSWTNLIGLNALSILGFGHSFIYTMIIVYLNIEHIRSFKDYLNLAFVVIAVASVVYLYFGQDNSFMIFATVAVNASLVIICYYILGNFIDLKAMVMVAKFRELAKIENIDLDKLKTLSKEEIKATKEQAMRNTYDSLDEVQKKDITNADFQDKELLEFTKLIKKKL